YSGDLILILTVFLSFFSGILGAQPEEWNSVGIGGGGALFAPSISPHDDSEYFVSCDMTDLFHSIDAGQTWDVVPFTEIRSFPESEIQFTNDPNILYALHYDFVADRKIPVVSIDGGQHWSPVTADPTDGEAYYLLADPGSTQRLFVTNYESIFFSDDGGNSFAEVYTNLENDGAYIAGAFWQDSEIFIAVTRGILHSTDGGSQFQLLQYPGISNSEGIVSFSAAKNGDLMRFFAVTLNREDIYPTVTGADHWGFVSCYILDYNGTGEWISADNGLGPDDHPFFVKADPNDPSTAYLGGGNGETAFPIVFKTENGGQNWVEVFKTIDNENIITGWSGYRGDFDWWYGEYVLGMDISPTNPDIVVFSDLGYVHSSRDGGVSWQQNYVQKEDENPAGQPTPQGLAYRTNGLENTSCWWLTWTGPEEIFASFTDITAIRSDDGGESWSRNYFDLDYNSVYQVLKTEDANLLYAAVSSIHDIYQSTYLQDADFAGGDGGIMYSADGGEGWNLVHDFGNPVIWLTQDASNSKVMYASVVSADQGGIYRTNNLNDLDASQWVKLTSPSRTEGHPLCIHSLEDGTLVATYSGRRSSGGAFTASSGVFVSTDGGESWQDRSDPGMLYWTKDLIIDPHDLSQNTWYAGVHSGWGGAPNGLGGLYKTTDRGQTWNRILVLDRVESCSIDPHDPAAMYVTTEAEGLWYTNSLNQTGPEFSLVETYPFQHPMRVFFDPYEPGKIWITSFGNGIRVGTTTGTSTGISDIISSDPLVFQVYPNPVDDFLTVDFQLHLPDKIDVKLYDETGRFVQNLSSNEAIYPSGKSSVQVDISSHPPGLYFLRFKHGAAAGFRKVLKIH
ncbi:MAG: T9SS type A sorting domain-containing protein, partial [Saprospiraceae bacterium]|nr:T9SS type A sorting domain-containing protein [Saprospiraceae bacterium]